jgi:hypothetical protein
MPIFNPLNSDPESADQGSGGFPKGFGTLKEKVKPKGEGFSDPVDGDTDPKTDTGPKAGRKETMRPKGKS